ncbi:hypothetical protein D9611_010602 [Ephemerocybe angulata]|uniref:Uncharacterized protein n=1 Tax=Ephemerocybe angulata TaxID=980116 RepID=A0A8H5BVA0_9AGAR|nr:hypothetical protein D9611_010602 [Tulosesus angulatus]
MEGRTFDTVNDGVDDSFNAVLVVELAGSYSSGVLVIAWLVMSSCSRRSDYIPRDFGASFEKNTLACAILYMIPTDYDHASPIAVVKRRHDDWRAYGSFTLRVVEVEPVVSVEQGNRSGESARSSLRHVVEISPGSTRGWALWRAAREWVLVTASGGDGAECSLLRCIVKPRDQKPSISQPPVHPNTPYLSAAVAPARAMNRRSADADKPAHLMSSASRRVA